MFYNISYLQTLKQLLIRSFLVYKSQFKDKIINGIIWSSITIIVFAYIMPSIGLKDFGSFMLFTTAISWGFFTTINNIVAFVSDITNEGSNLQYELTLPIPQWLIFFKYALENTYQAFIISMLIVPFGKLLLWDEFSLAHFSIFKFYLILIISCFFFGNFSVLMSSITKDIYTGIENIWLRIIFPMWFLGGFQFSWKTLYGISPTVAYINLLNPLTYALEGGRAAALDPELSLPYWSCVSALIIASCLFGYIGITKLKKRLDCL